MQGRVARMIVGIEFQRKMDLAQALDTRLLTSTFNRVPDDGIGDRGDDGQDGQHR